MSKIRSSGTSPEAKVQQLFRHLKIKYRKNVKSLPGKPDFVIKSKKTVIFVHGCFWHMHLNCSRSKLPKTNKSFWKKKIDSNRIRDTRVARLLRKEGWQVLTIWQCSLRNKERVLKKLKRYLA